MAESRPIRVLYMEDDPGLARLLKRRLERQGYVVTVARDGEEGLAMYGAASYDVVVVDQNMPVYDGLEVIRRLASWGPLPPLIMFTGTGNEEIAVEAMRLGAHDCIVKDLEGGYLDLLPAVIQQVIQWHHLVREKGRTDEALRQTAKELEESNRELDALVRTVAHGLKSRLYLLITYSILLAEHLADAEDEVVQRSVSALVKNSSMLGTIVDELLLLASVRKREEVLLAPLHMGASVAAAQQRLAGLIGEHQAQVILPEEWPVAMGYQPWIEEVWVKLIGNAVQYGGRPDAGVPPRVELGAGPVSEATTGTPMIRFWVRDNGPGLSLEEQDDLFAEFTQMHQLSTEGRGLGLSVVRRIVEKLGGQVGVESEVGQGSLFFFTLRRS